MLQKRKKAVRDGALNNQELRKLVLYLKNGADCPCPQLNNTGNHYLIMGRNVGKRYLMTGIHYWDEENAEFRKLLNQIKTYKCPTREPIFK